MKQPEPQLLSRRQIRAIKITRIGWAFIALTIGIGIAGLNTGNNLLYLIFGMLLSMLLINAVLSTASLNNLQISFAIPSRLYVGDNNPLKVTLQNLKQRFPSYSLTLSQLENKKSYFLFKIGPQQLEQFIHFHHFQKRGLCKLPDFQLLSTYPFGLIEKRIPIRLQEEWVVYPKLHPVNSVAMSQAFLRGDYLSGEKGLGINPYGIREYQYGDDVRHIHWRSFAKVGKWMIKEFELEKKPKITIHLLSGTDPMNSPADQKRREQAISLSASLLMHFIEENRQVSLWLNQQAMDPGDTTGYIDYYLTILALYDQPNAQHHLPQNRHRADSETGMIIAVTDGTDVKQWNGVHYDVMLQQDSQESLR